MYVYIRTYLKHIIIYTGLHALLSSAAPRRRWANVATHGQVRRIEQMARGIVRAERLYMVSSGIVRYIGIARAERMVKCDGSNKRPGG